MVMVV